ncbi:galactokinase [Glycomyces algeriensis]|uniref:Galactokinase n=2 Tax=Glycomyces algeriensis TaxID=256037 RepID=A0A9W6G417_9ACTN|nr:galactokinase [Glycomyces algeriensis]MDA1367713.1 galactokinase [Glycomyces algeriensis]MDR7352923.1 galactokinase [Glycomyces algeriensis]GLI40610.1 galactokinase [Glycomyces algeriensis]
MPTPDIHAIELAETAAAAFRDVFGAEPEGLWAAPGRVNLIGEHTDYNEGFVMPFALPFYSVAAVAKSDTWEFHSTYGGGDTVRTDTLEGVEGWAGYLAGVAWAMNESGYPVDPVRIAINSDVPHGGGLSSSAALECSVIIALADLFGHEIDRTELARIVQKTENEYMGAPTGILDQSASLLCTEGNVMFMDCRDFSREQVPFDLAAGGLVMLVIDTQAPHRHVDGEYGARRADCEEAARQLGVPFLRDAPRHAKLDDERLNRRMHHILTENERVLATVAILKQGNVAGIGDLLTASHVSLRDDYEVSSVELDSAVDAALGAGALGARMTGGGFGGSAIALVEAAAAPKVEAAVIEAAADKGLPVPRVFVARAAAGAHRVL